MPLSPSLRLINSSTWLVRVILGHDAVGKVGPVEAGDKAARRPQLQERHDIVLHALSGGRGQSQQRHFGKVAQFAQLAVLGTEIVAPFADAVGFVNGEQRDRPALERGEEIGQHKAFGRHVKQAVLALIQAAKAGAAFRAAQRRIEKRGRHADGLERVHLVFHQGDQRRNHHGQARAGERGQLEAE